MKRLLYVVLSCGALFLFLCPILTGSVSKAMEKKFIKGIVYDEITNRPVPKLSIYSDPSGTKVAETDKNGVFEYPVEAGQETVQILPFSHDIVGRSVFVNVKEFENKAVTIVVEHGMKLTVRVRDAQGKPVENARVTYMPGGGAVGLTKGDGVAVIGMVSRFRNGTLTVEAPDYQTSVQEDIYAPLYADEGITVTLEPQTQKQ